MILDRPNADVAVTLSAGVHNIRKLYVREAFHITGGMLTVNYTPSADSTPIAGQFSAPVLLGGGSLSIHTLQVDAANTLELNSGGLTFNSIQLNLQDGTPAKILVTGDIHVGPLANAAAIISNGLGSGDSASVDLGGGMRTITVVNGSSATDVTFGVPMVNGGLTKAGAGVLALEAANTYTGDTAVEAGTLRLSDASLANAADIYLTTGATLDLAFAGADIIDSLFIDGASMLVGTWGATGSGAQFTSDAIMGAGLLQVSTYSPSTVLGDYNEDGVVDAADYVVWRDSFGSDAALPNDDSAGVDQDDYDRWKARFGETNLGGAGSANLVVPEPQSACLLAIAYTLSHFARRLR